jgi:hypothetical protein
LRQVRSLKPQTSNLPHLRILERNSYQAFAATLPADPNRRPIHEMLTEMRKWKGIFAFDDGHENHFLALNEDGERPDFGEVSIDADHRADDRTRGW